MAAVVGEVTVTVNDEPTTPDAVVRVSVDEVAQVVAFR